MKSAYGSMISRAAISAVMTALFAAPIVGQPASGGRHVGPASHSVGRVFLLIHAAPLKQVADEWAAYRAAQGWRTIVLASMPGPDEAATRRSLQNAIRATWRECAAASPPQELVVLLLGDVPAEADADGVPTWRFPQTDPTMRLARDDGYVSDHPYQLADDADDLPDFALGRVPVSTVAEARAVLDKIRRHEAAPVDAPGRDRIVYAAGEGHFGAMDGVLESLFMTMVDRLVPPAYDISVTYAKASSIYCPPPSRLTETVLERLAEPALLFNYIGHGFERGFDSLHWRGQRLPILDTHHLDGLTAPVDDSGARAIAFLSCCSVGWFDLRGREGSEERSLAEAMLLHPAGPVAVIAGSRVTHPYANAALQMDVTRALLTNLPPPLLSRGRAGVGVDLDTSARRPRTVGDLDLRAEHSLVTPDPFDRQLDLLTGPIARGGDWATSLPELRRMHVRLYNLLGDPATRIAAPAQIIDELAIRNGTLHGRIKGMTSGRVTLSLETERASMACAADLQMPIGNDDPDLERKAANNYPLVNDRVLAKLEGEVGRDGEFAIAVPATLPEGAAMVRVSAAGLSAEGEAFTAIGVLRLPQPTM